MTTLSLHMQLPDDGNNVHANEKKIKEMDTRVPVALTEFPPSSSQKYTAAIQMDQITN